MLRKLDELGRIVIPVEFRKKFNWTYKDEIDIIEIDNGIMLQKYNRKKCKHCNNSVAKRDKYCSKCGNKL